MTVIPLLTCRQQVRLAAYVVLLSLPDECADDRRRGRVVLFARPVPHPKPPQVTEQWMQRAALAHWVAQERGEGAA